jgi:hypothetical protein
MDAKTEMAFRFEQGLPLVVQLEECAVKAFVDEFGVRPTVFKVAEDYAGVLPVSIGGIEVRVIHPGPTALPNEYWLAVEPNPTK